jgi:hypothetical protein
VLRPQHVIIKYQLVLFGLKRLLNPSSSSTEAWAVLPSTLPVSASVQAAIHQVTTKENNTLLLR